MPVASRPPRHVESDHNDGMHGRDYMAENVDLPGLLERLSAGRDALRLLAGLTDEQLDTVPSTGRLQILRWAEDPGAGRNQFAEAPGPSDRRSESGHQVNGGEPRE